MVGSVEGVGYRVYELWNKHQSRLVMVCIELKFVTV